MPKPRLAGDQRIWDVEELDLAFKNLPREDGGYGSELTEATTDSWTDYR